MNMASEQHFQTPEKKKNTTLLHGYWSKQIQKEKEHVLYLRALFQAFYTYLFKKALSESGVE